MRLTADELRTRAKELAEESKACIELAKGMDRYRDTMGVELVAVREGSAPPRKLVATRKPRTEEAPAAPMPPCEPIETVEPVPVAEITPPACAEPPVSAPDEVSMGEAAQHIKALHRPSGWAVEDDCDLIRFVGLGWRAHEIAQDVGRDANFINARMQALYGRKKPHDPAKFLIADLQAGALELTFAAKK